MSAFPDAAIAAGARAAVAATIATGAAAYDRAVLSRLVPLGPDAITDESRAGSVRILKALRRALRAERARGRAGHWTYDLNRHLALLQACEGERRRAAAWERRWNARPSRPAPDAPTFAREVNDSSSSCLELTQKIAERAASSPTGKSIREE